MRTGDIISNVSDLPNSCGLRLFIAFTIGQWYGFRPNSDATL
jgi:hypothetical protein